ncbi:hypothetical protein PO124_25210 [Bacillus licheniformis]|nr:hypothetical protein [Bacillus licheniformis]
MLQLLCHLFPKGTTVGFEIPDFIAQNSPETGGFNVVPIPVDESGISVQDLEQYQPQLAYTTPSHQFPLGMIMPVGRRLQLLDWAAATGAYIIEDDYDGEFRYAGQPIPSLQGLDRNDRVIYLGTFQIADSLPQDQLYGSPLSARQRRA